VRLSVAEGWPLERVLRASDDRPKTVAKGLCLKPGSHHQTCLWLLPPRSTLDSSWLYLSKRLLNSDLEPLGEFLAHVCHNVRVLLHEVVFFATVVFEVVEGRPLPPSRGGHARAVFVSVGPTGGAYETTSWRTNTKRGMITEPASSSTALES